MHLFDRRLLAFCLLLACWSPAHAYLDPGTGSVLIQGLIASVAAAGVVARLYWHRLTAFFASRKNQKPPQSEDVSDEQ